LKNWRNSIFFPALKTLVRDGVVDFGLDAEDDVWYAIREHLPDGVEKKPFEA